MPVQIQNRIKRLVSVRLNSGQTLHLPPRARSSELADAEVSGNAKVQKLLDQDVISLSSSDKPVQTSPAITEVKAEPKTEND